MFMCTVNKAIGIYFYTRQLNNEMINETCNNFWNALYVCTYVCTYNLLAIVNLMLNSLYYQSILCSYGSLYSFGMHYV